MRSHTEVVNGVAFSPDGRRLVSGSSDRTLKVWDVATGQELQTLKGHSNFVWDVAFSPDGQWVASASQDRTVKVWDGRPLTPQVQAEREALRLVEFLLAQPLCRHDVLERLRGRFAIRDEVRRWALLLANGCRDGPQFDAACWAVVRRADAATDRYLHALVWAQRAHQLDPDNGAYRTTLGVAQYRAGQYQEAVATLTPRASPRAASAVRLSPTDLAFLTMAHHQLGQYAEAQAWLERLRRLQRERVSYDEWYDHDADVQAFLREVEVLLQGAQALP